MNAKKYLAACTAALLALGFSLGASSAALADEAPEETTEVIVETLGAVVDENEQEESESESGDGTIVVTTVTQSPASHNDDHVVGGSHPDNGANRVTLCHATPPDTAAQGWVSITIDDDAAATNQAGHDSEHDMDIIPAFDYWLNIGNGNGPKSEWVKLTYPGKNLTADFGGVTGAQILANDCEKPAVPTIASAAIATSPSNCFAAETLNEEEFAYENATYVITPGDGGTFTVTFTATGEALFAEGDDVSVDRKTKVFNGTLEEMWDDNDPRCVLPIAEAGIAFNPPTCDTAQSLNEDGFTSVNASYDITLGPGAAYVVVFTAGDGAVFDQLLTGVTDDGTKHTFGGDLLPQLTGPLCDDLETFPNWTASASAVDAECDGDNGAILIEPVDGSLENPTPVRYFLNFGEVNQFELISVSTPVPPGTYAVTAMVTDLSDSVNDSGTSDEWELTVGVTGEDCEQLTTLAHTGAVDISGALGALAALAMIAGTGLVIRRRGAFTLGA